MINLNNFLRHIFNRRVFGLFDVVLSSFFLFLNL
jgi:hypothetical protein